jgi:hypothetical protein
VASGAGLDVRFVNQIYLSTATRPCTVPHTGWWRSRPADMMLLDDAAIEIYI